MGDLGTLLPLAVGMIIINGLNPAGLFLAVGLFYILSGVYFGITVSVQPMKVIGAYAVATAVTASQITAASFLIALVLLVIGATGAITLLGKYTPKSVVRGVQVSTGALLMSQGVKFMLGTSKFQALQGMAEPYLSLQNLGPLPLGLIIGVLGGIITFWLLDNRRFPAGLIIIILGICIGVVLGNHQGFDRLSWGLYWPAWMPFGMPSAADVSFALLVLVLPQIPMTLGNAVIANADLSNEYFGTDSKKVTPQALCISMGLINIFCALVGGMPLCHGAGGLAAHYRFGARTAGSNVMIGTLFLVLALFLGSHSLALMNLIPMSVLGVLLLFAGSQLALTMQDMRTRKDLFVVLVMLGITLASNLAAGFVAGMLIAYTLKSDRLNV